jgi:serine/threonine protein phosphatase PrpC
MYYQSGTTGVCIL